MTRVLMEGKGPGALLIADKSLSSLLG